MTRWMTGLNRGIAAAGVAVVVFSSTALGMAAHGGTPASGHVCGRTSVLLARARANHDPLVPPLEQALVVRCGTFPIRLYRNGRLVISGSCYVHEFRFRDYSFVEYRLERTRLLLPRGTWIIEGVFKTEDGHGSGGLTKQSSHFLTASGRITAFETHLGGQDGGVGRKTTHIACGVSAERPAPPPDLRVPVISSYTIISWPAFESVATGRQRLPW